MLAEVVGDIAWRIFNVGAPQLDDVVHGKKLGRSLGASASGLGDGFRTLNLRFSHPKPAALGIFAVRVHGLADTPLDGVASLGKNPTVDTTDSYKLEVHLFDFAGDLYGQLISVRFLAKLRDEQRFDSLAALTAQIDADAAAARHHLSTLQRVTA